MTKHHVVIWDIDGVLCDNVAALERFGCTLYSEMDWDRYGPAWWSSLRHMEPIEGWCALLRSLQNQYIVLVTNRPESIRDDTELWLDRNAIPFNELRMRDALHYHEAKVAHVREMKQRDYRIKYAVDDDPMHGLMYEAQDIPFIYAHSGHFA